MTRTELDKRADQVLERNWTGEYTRPANHYPHQFLWDSSYAAIIYARRGKLENAETEIQTLLKGMDQKTGFIPNMRFHQEVKWWDLESYTFNDRSFGSSYTQPPLLAYAVWEIYESFIKEGEKEKGKKFLRDIYGEVGQEKVSGLKGSYEYFIKYRENGNGSKLIGVIHPNETGRDSDPSLKQGARRILHHGVIANFGLQKAMHTVNTGLDVVSAAKINVKAKLLQWDLKKMKEKVYWVNDVMFNVFYANNLRYLSRIADELNNDTDAQYYKDLANAIEKEIVDKMWNDDDKFFYNLDKNGNQIPIASITGLFPITLDNISEDQLTGLLDKIENQNWFGTPYPLPSLPVNSPYYDPHYEEKRLWRGPVWINLNHGIAEEGLVKQIERFEHNKKLSYRMINFLKHLVEKTEELPSKNGPVNFFEFYDPETGRGYRINYFTWTLLALHFEKSKALLAKVRLET